MTDAEALKLRPGDVVLTSILDRVTPVEVLEVAPLLDSHGEPWAVRVVVCRLGWTKRGESYPNVMRRAAEVVRLPRPDAPAFHVAADWLEEHGEERAAALLRRAFPLNGEG